MAPQPKLLLYDSPGSPFAQKVRMALRFKILDFEREMPQILSPGPLPEGFVEANPRKEVPALVVDGKWSVFGSSNIMMYLEDAFTDGEKHTSFFPGAGDSGEDGMESAKRRAEARMIEEVCDTSYEAINWGFGEVSWFGRAEGAEAERLMDAAREQTKVVMAWLTDKLGDKPFFSGNEFGYADIAVAPVLNRSVYIGLGPEEGSALKLWHERVGTVDCVKETWEEAAVMLPKMKSLGKEAWAKETGRRREYRDHRLEFLVKNGGIDIVKKGLEDGNVKFGWPYVG